MSRLQEIQARVDAATPGPWTDKDGFLIGAPIIIWNGLPGWQPEQARENTSLVAHAPDDIVYLLARIRELEAGLAEYESELNWSIVGGSPPLFRWVGDGDPRELARSALAGECHSCEGRGTLLIKPNNLSVYADDTAICRTCNGTGQA